MTHERCRYCHEFVAADEVASHEAEHRKLRADGQQEEYLALPEEPQ